MKLKLINIADFFVSVLIIVAVIFSLHSAGIKTDIILFVVGMFMGGKIIGMISMLIYMSTKYDLWKKMREETK